MDKLYYKIGEVAGMLGESESCVRYWTKAFEGEFKTPRSSKGNRQYTMADVDKLRQIKLLLKTQGLTIEGAAHELKARPKRSENVVKAVNSLKLIREQLLEIRNSI